jgi:PAS domain S-box-containing protein
MKENGTRRTAGTPAHYRRAATILVVGCGSCCAVLVCDRVLLSGQGGLSAALFYASLLALLVCSLRAGRLLYSRPAPDPTAGPLRQEHAGILEHLPCFAAALDGEGMNDYTNQRLLDYVGRDSAEVAGHRWMDTIHADERETVRGEWQRCAAAGVAMDVNHRMLRHDGAYRWFHARVEPSLDGRGRVTRWHAVLTDIDDRVRAEEALRERERQLRQMVDAIPAMLIINSPAGEVEYVNKPLVDLFGRGLETLRDSGWADLVHPEDAEALFARLRDVYANGEALDTEYRMLCADGSYRWIQCRKQPLVDEAGRVVCWYGVLSDIDDRKRAEEELRRSRERLAASMRLAALAELSASIAHEINQPLAAVVTNGHACQGWLSADTPNVERARLILDRVIRDGNAAADVVRRIRALFKETAPAKELLDVNEVVVEAHRLVLEELSRKKVEVGLELGEGLPPAPADRVQLQQVLVNLMHNGAEAMEAVRDRPRILTVRTRRDDADVVVEVSDRGGGLQDIRRVFEPFFTTKEGGMGVGLAICRSIVEAHGGRVWAENREPGGATVTFTLPADADDEP